MNELADDQSELLPAPKGGMMVGFMRILTPLDIQSR